MHMPAIGCLQSQRLHSHAQPDRRLDGVHQGLEMQPTQLGMQGVRGKVRCRHPHRVAATSIFTLEIQVDLLDAFIQCGQHIQTHGSASSWLADVRVGGVRETG